MIREEEKIMDVEQLRDSMLQSVAGYSQSIPALASQGQDPMMAIRQIAAVIDARKKGVPIEKAVADAFEPEKTPEGEAAVGAEAPQQMAGPEGTQTPAGIPPQGQGQSMQQLLSGLRGNGESSMSARTMMQRNTA